ncbi:MAG: UDP-3-O-(3-hydroxymyristoyl)glucosamine N-acyltransferase [Opitutaceae bacterium]
MDVSVGELITLINGTLLSGSPDHRIVGFASLKEAKPGDLTFFYDSRYHKQLMETAATAALVPSETTQFPDKLTCIGVANPSQAFEIIVEKFGLQPIPFKAGIHPSATIGKDVVINPGLVCVGPGAVIDERAWIGDGVTIGANAYVGPDVRIGKDSFLHPNATVLQACLLGERVIIHSSAVIGADGFGYVLEKGRHRKIRQAGIVQIDNDVEVGAATTIDRARFGRTWIGEGTKIDNLVQIAHNVIVGKHCIIVSQTGIAGSSILEDYVVAAAQVGIAGHVTIGRQSTLAARAGVLKDLPGGHTYLGYPAVPIQEEQRLRVHIRRLPKTLERIKELENRLAALESQSSVGH